MSEPYDFRAIEPKWQAAWDAQKSFRAVGPGQPGSDRPKYYVLDFFPYPSGAGLHVGHPLGYIATDILARVMRMRGFNVLHPMGWDAFGLPAEQYAIETGIHPRITTRKNIETYKRQLRMLGLSYDWDREIATSDAAYYRWTQWIFLRIYNSWYDPEQTWTDRAGRTVRGAARPIDTLPIPPDIRRAGPAAVEEYQAEHRLAYLAEVPVNWCPALGTVLSNEEVTSDGRSERGNHPVYRRPMKQWMMRITEYADRLLADLDGLDWPDAIKLQQRNWIGRSEGAYVDFVVADGGPAAGEVIRVFTTRPDTLYGATYMVLAPEHRLVAMLTSPERRENVDAYVRAAAQKSDLDRTAETKKKTGVFTGGYAINPVNGRRVPIWVADYVLIHYGTGSIMSVPGHDVRDLEFAETFGLDVVQVVAPPAGADWRGYEGDGVACQSPPAGASGGPPDACVLNGLPTPQAKRAMIRWLGERGCGEGTVQYKLRDWLFSRQRYWGEPFPVLYGPDGRIAPLRDDELPLTLPDLQDFRPSASEDPNADPQTPLSRAPQWLTVQRDGQTWQREVSTMPNWAGSCWYYLRFCDPSCTSAPVGESAERYWSAVDSGRLGMVDLYLGGAEHAVLHLLYARFWHKVLYDLGVVSTPEPFARLFNQGMIGAAAYVDERGTYVEATEVVDADGRRAIEHPDSAGPFFHAGRPVTREIGKMGKSLKNVVNPDGIVAEYGADTLRLYEMYMGPLEASKPWNTRDIIGVHRFLQRVWRLVLGDVREPVEGAGGPPAAALSERLVPARDPAVERLLHKTIRKVSHDVERMAFNTAIAQMIVFVNEASRAPQIGRDQVERFLLLLAPFAPHVCEELWSRLGHRDLLARAAWPTWDEALCRDDEVEIAVQVNGKVRARIMVPADGADEQLLAAARQAPAVMKEIADKPLKKGIVVKGRLVNLIV